jgi:hypothetical protein
MAAADTVSDMIISLLLDHRINDYAGERFVQFCMEVECAHDDHPRTDEATASHLDFPTEPILNAQYRTT